MVKYLMKFVVATLCFFPVGVLAVSLGLTAWQAVTLIVANNLASYVATYCISITWEKK